MTVGTRTEHRDRIVALARGWIGTPYHHQAALKGVGVDCLGLVRGVWTALYGVEPEAPPPYSPDWAEASRGEPMLLAARRHLLEIPAADAGAGDVIVFRWRAGAPAKHAAILSSSATMIHAVEGAAVAEVSLAPWWRRRIAGAFSFPEV